MDNFSKTLTVRAEAGLVFLNQSHKLVAFDLGAASILDCPAQPIPAQILDLVRNCKLDDASSFKSNLRMGATEYVCRAYHMEAYSGRIFEPLIAVQLERVSVPVDAVYKISLKYNLTDREQQALRGISMGLTSKEVAERMSISPNTVKAFLRLIMIKMGVTTRGGIVANILNPASMDSMPSGPELNMPGQPESQAF